MKGMDHATKTPRGIVYRTKPCCMGPLYFMYTPFSPDGLNRWIWAAGPTFCPNVAIWREGGVHKVKGSHATRFGPIDYSLEEMKGMDHATKTPRGIVYGV